MIIAFQSTTRSKNATNTFMQKMRMFRPIIKPETGISSNVITIISNEKMQNIQQRVETRGDNIYISQQPPSQQPPSQQPPSLISISLYPFTTHTFTNAGALGHIGPTLTQIRTAYVAIPWAERFINMNNNNGIQLWTVPTTGKYLVRAIGSSGGTSGSSINGGFGLGRDIQSIITFKKGDVIKILVGQRGTRSLAFNTGGGGGTFITTNNNEPIIVAGGGGGRGTSTAIIDINSDGSDDTFGRTPYTNSTTRIAIETLRVRGTMRVLSGGHASVFGGGGGGLYGNGEDCLYNMATGGKSFANGGIGGNSGDVNNTCFGGFGGGGGGGSGSPNSINYAGGGGGYSGGGGGGLLRLANNLIGSGFGGGGGSFSITQFTNNGVSTGHGRVIITLQ